MEDRVNQNYDFIAIGDIVTDAFIRLKDAEVHCKLDKEQCELCVRFGDKVPYESVTILHAVGNSPNAAVCASRLGLNTALISDLGEDRVGSECLTSLKQEKISTEFVHVHREYKTNYHYVLWYGDDRTILIKHENYPYSLPNFGNPKWLYLSSLGQNALTYQSELQNYLVQHPEIKVAFQPGTFQMRLGFDELRKLYNRTQLFFCNKEEAQRMLDSTEDKPEILAEMISYHGPRQVIITDGPKGAYLFDGHLKWFMPPYPDPKPPLERTGAGDAFSSTVTACLAMGMDIHDALLFAPVNSMSVVQQIGAQAGLLTQDEIRRWIDKAPENYKLQRI